MASLPRHQRPSRLRKFLFGVPYYPEHWTPEDRELDPQRMTAAGVNVVRMGEFAWDLMKPKSVKFDFSLFDETIDRLGNEGTCRCGAEIYWNGILHHDNISRRRYAEFSQEGQELKSIGDRILGTVALVRAAVLVEVDQDEALDTMPMGLPGDEARRNADLPAPGAADHAVEITCRHAVDRKLTFVLNHHGNPQTVEALPEELNLLTGEACRGEIELAPYDVAIN